MSGGVTGGREWTAQLESHVEQAVTRAARPFAEMVPANAPAVLFRDESEMLACLARDWRGRDAWWWRSLLGRDADEALVHQRLIDAPTLLPSIVSLLAESGAAHDVLRAMPVAVCAALIDGVTRAFALPREVSAPELEGTTRETVQSGDHVHREAQRSLRALHSVLQGAGCTGAVTTMQDEPRHLLVLCLLVARAPALARARPCAPLLARWDVWNRSFQQRSSVRSSMPGANARSDADARQAMTSVSEQARSLAAHRGADDMDVAPTSHAPHARRRNDFVPVPHDTSALHADERDVMNVSSPTAPEAVAATPASDSTPSPLPSNYAGVFYLVNVLLHMELYADFANPERPSIPVALGDLLALIGERYCSADIRHDPIWRVLAEIAGRDSRQQPRRALRAGAVRRRDVRVFERWLADLLARMEERLSRALAIPAEHTVAYLCARRGTLALTDTRLDVRFPLAEHPLAIRLAGLDRDAGWVPATGRIIEFHYD